MTNTKPPEPAAATPPPEVDRGPGSAESDAQRGLQKAQDAFARAEAMVAARESTAASIAADLAAADAEVARLDSAHEVDADHMLAAENQRRKVRRLEADLVAAREAVRAARDQQEEADRGVRIAQIEVLDAELVEMDAEHIADAKASRERFAMQRAAIFKKLREAHELHRSLWSSPAQSDPWARRTLVGTVAEQTDGLVAASEVLERVTAIDQYRAQGGEPGGYAAHVYRPPRDERGDLDSNN